MDRAAVDVIGIENFAATMPKWDPGNKSQRYAVVDMGSNGIRFSVTCLEPPRSRLLRCLFRERVAISLFDVLTASPDSRFPPSVIVSVTEALSRFVYVASTYNVPFHHISVFATEAMRKSNNAADMLEHIHKTTGLKVHILSGMVETLFGAAGARSAFAGLKGLVLDLGGGSVQMTWMDSTASSEKEGEGEGVVTSDDERRVDKAGQDSIELKGYEVAAARAGRSMPFGAARVTGVLESGDAKKIETTKAELSTQLRESFATLTREFPVLREMVDKSTRSGKQADGFDIFLCGGGFRGYGNMLMHSQSLNGIPHPVSSIGSYRVDGEAFSKTRKMANLHVEEGDSKIFGLSKRRRSQFPAVIEVVDALLAAIQPARIRSATFCAGSNREGALFMMLPREIREMNPLPLLAPRTSLEDTVVTENIHQILNSAIPEGLIQADTPTLFSLGLAPMFIQNMWSRPGGDAEFNAAALLHEAIAGNDALGMTHTARAILALTSAARWQAMRARDFSPVERQLWKGLKKVVGEEAYFWCAFLGTVGMCVGTVVSAWPKSPIGDIVNFDVSMEQGKNNNKIILLMKISKHAAMGLDFKTLGNAFNKVKMQDEAGGLGKKVDFSINIVEYLPNLPVGTNV